MRELIATEISQVSGNGAGADIAFAAAGAWASTVAGAAAGSIIPGAGTLAGGAVGFVLGLAISVGTILATDKSTT